MIDLARLEEWIRSGEFSKVEKAVLALNIKKVQRAEFARLANIANRADLSRVAFRLLNPIIRSEKLVAAPSDLERIEYAEALRRMGLVNEALGIFQALDSSSFPLVHLRIAFCHFKKWQYLEAIPHLKALIDVTDPKDYLSSITKVNLAAAYVHERRNGEALGLLQELRVSTRAAGQFLLLGNCLELISQVFIGQRDWTAADSVLNEAEQIFAKDHSKYALFVHKWRAIARSLQHGRVHSDLINCQIQARQSENWETQRDCDFYIGLIERDQRLLQRVYFGTPYASFRRRILDLTGESFKPPSSYIWRVDGDGPVDQVFDSVKGTTDSGNSALESGRLLHQLMIVLSSDFYQPVSTGSAFSTLFPDEHFAQLGSANRVSQLMMRLRQWLKKENLGLSVLGQNGKYRLQGDTHIGIRVPREMPIAGLKSIAWCQVEEKLPSGVFSRQDVVKASQCSPASAKRLLRWAVESGRAESMGTGARVRYQRKAA